MASTINALTSGGGLTVSGDTSGSLQLQTNNGTTAMTIDTSQNVGIGTTSPLAKLDLGTSYVTPATNTAADVKLAVTALSSTEKYGFFVDNTGSLVSLAGPNAGGGQFRWASGSTERMRIDSSGNLLVGTTSANGKITSNIGSANSSCYTAAFTGAGGSGLGFRSSYENSTGTAYHMYMVYNGTGVGAITSNSTTTTYGTSSDYRLKENIAPMTGALDKVAQLKPVTYTWKADGSKGQGFIAHELQAVVPDCVTGEKDAVDDEGKPVYQGIDTSFLVATLTAAIQELNAKVTALESQLGAK